MSDARHLSTQPSALTHGDEPHHNTQEQGRTLTRRNGGLTSGHTRTPRQLHSMPANAATSPQPTLRINSFFSAQLETFVGCQRGRRARQPARRPPMCAPVRPCATARQLKSTLLTANDKVRLSKCVICTQCVCQSQCHQEG